MAVTKASTPLLEEDNSIDESDKDCEDSVTISTQGLSWKERTKQLLPFLGLFTPLVVFWAIFFQQSSTWVVQGRDMNCYIGRLHVPPGQYIQRERCPIELSKLIIALFQGNHLSHLHTFVYNVRRPENKNIQSPCVPISY